MKIEGRQISILFMGGEKNNPRHNTCLEWTKCFVEHSREFAFSVYQQSFHWSTLNLHTKSNHRQLRFNPVQYNQPTTGLINNVHLSFDGLLNAWKMVFLFAISEVQRNKWKKLSLLLHTAITFCVYYWCAYQWMNVWWISSVVYHKYQH